MNRQHTLQHLREAAEELQRTIHRMENEQAYGSVEFSVAMEHLYHHLNTAWNARDESPERVRACSDEDFLRWGQFPEDLYLDE